MPRGKKGGGWARTVTTRAGEKIGFTECMKIIFSIKADISKLLRMASFEVMMAEGEIVSQ